MKRTTKKGQCPWCRGLLTYGLLHPQDEEVYWDVSCVCGFSGKEWYSLKFEEVKAHGTPSL